MMVGKNTLTLGALHLLTASRCSSSNTAGLAAVWHRTKVRIGLERCCWLFFRAHCSPPDSTFLYTTPLSTFGFWLALEDVTIDNGALWAIPGSHLEWPINRRFVRASQGGVKFDGSDNYPEESDPRWKPLECAAGTLILIHGSVLHYSKPNNSGVSRNAWTFHIIDSAAAYSELNWLNPPALVPL